MNRQKTGQSTAEYCIILGLIFIVAISTFVAASISIYGAFFWYWGKCPECPPCPTTIECEC